MSKRTGSTDQTICHVLRRHRGQRTVLAVALPVLAAQLNAVRMRREFSGLTEKEIQRGFCEIAGKYLKSDYHSTYIARRLGPRGFLETIDGRYRIRQSLLKRVSIEELAALHDELVASLKSAYEERQAAMQRLEATCKLPPECIAERHSLINAYLSDLSGNRGEMFEVVSFAVLREYFRSFGFSLQRFSTTHANDGGMDFVAGDAIYQVSTDESAHKLQKDLAKAPGAKRVLVRPTVTQEIMDLCEGDVLEVIHLKDLLSHFIAWLFSRDNSDKRPRRMQSVLVAALEEFRRENKAQAGE